MDYNRDVFQIVFGYVSWLRLENDTRISKMSLNIEIVPTENAVVPSQNS